MGSDEVELYHRTYTTLLRSSGETRLRVLEPSHAAMNSSLHPLANTSEPDLGAFMYAVRRLPAGIFKANPIVMGQEAVEFRRHGIGDLETWEAREAPARRRWWFDNGSGTLAVLLASTSDLDDLIPTLVAYQIEWNKLHALARATERPAATEPDPADCAEGFGGAVDDWMRVRDAVGRLAQRLPRRGLLAAAEPAHPHAQRQPGRLRAHDPALDGPDPRGDGRAGPLGPPDLLRLLQHALAREPRHGHRALARGRDRRPHRRARPGLPARGAAEVPRGWRRGLVGELPLLRRAALLRRQARGRRGVEAADGGRARRRRDAPLQPHGAARLRPGDGAGPARPGRPRPPPRPARRLQAQGLRGRDRQHRVSARPRRLQHPARAHRGQRRAQAAPTCSARPRRSTPTSATC